MKRNIFFYLTIFCTMLLVACQKDIDIFIPDAGQQTSADTNWVNTITSTMPITQLKKALQLELHRDSTELNANISIVNNTASGLSCTFLPNTIVKQDGVTPVTGKVYLDMLLIKKKGDMIRMDKPTVSQGHVLASGGEIFVSVKQNGDELTIKPNGGYVRIKFADPAPNPAMKIFYGNETNPNQFTWNADSLQTSILSANLFYDIYSQKLRWINCDYFYDSAATSPKVKIAAKLPANYTNANSSAYLVFNNINAIMGMYGNATNRLFSTQNIPINKPATLIVISKQGSDYFMAKEHITTGVTNGTIGNLNQLVNMSPTKTTLQNIKDYLGTL